MPRCSPEILIWLFAGGFLVASCSAEQVATPHGVGGNVPPEAPVSAPASRVQAIPAPIRSTHVFWDRTNILLFSGVAAFRALDYASTRNFQARGREEVLIPDDVVNNSAGFASLEAAGTAASVGLSYWMHRVGHHKIERWISIVHIGITGFGVGRNYSLESKHPAP